MKQFKYLMLLLVMVFVLPFTVLAEGEEGEAVDNRVKVYFFRGEGCPHCAEAEEWFSKIQEEYGSKFQIVDYETWNDADNAELMQKVAVARGEEDEATGVPYIIIGDKSWVGFAESSMADEIKSQIDTVYAQAEADRYDVMELVETGATNTSSKKDSNGSDILALIIILVVVGGICFGVYKARNTVDEK